LSAIEISSKEIETSLILRSEGSEHISYVVEIEHKKEIHPCFNSENYLQSLIIAKKLFHRLKTKSSSDFAVMIESEHGRGAIYEINEFGFDAAFMDKESFYEELCNEFEHSKLTLQDNNTLFRKMVNKNKLNEYQEQRFLYFLKKFGNV
jgi:hypothetical protein